MDFRGLWPLKGQNLVPSILDVADGKGHGIQIYGFTRSFRGLWPLKGQNLVASSLDVADGKGHESQIRRCPRPFRGLWPLKGQMEILHLAAGKGHGSLFFCR